MDIYASLATRPVDTLPCQSCPTCRQKREKMLVPSTYRGEICEEDLIPSGPNKEKEGDQPVEEKEQDEQGECKPDEKEEEGEEVPPTGEHTLPAVQPATGREEVQAAAPGHPTSEAPAEPPQSQTSGQETPAEGKAMETEEASPREEGKDNKTSTGTDDRSEREKERDRSWIGKNQPLPGSYAYVHGRHGLTSEGLNHPGPDGTQHYC